MYSRELNLYFPFIDEEFMFATQPSRYISHLIGHEGPGSIMSYIRSKGWANGLNAGAYPMCPGTPAFRMIAAFRSSSDANAVSWNWYICSTIAESSFDAAVITVRVIAFLNTSIRRVAVPMPSGRYTAALCSPFLSVLCDPVASAIGSLFPDRTPLPGIQRPILGGSPQQLYVIC
ncbi:hypothetical protein BFJ68_g17432 [Fusarium oxysporum]|uniref:Uncharacterized protein n=1 Tax=Fusarium oxysporum TaxID=5507 RepID=A0A420NTH3_FUSOX|nr:hypothetical protein BFJ68_g17432 [Fusarium oxysporum]